MNNSIKHQSFVYAQLNDQTVLFQTIQFSMSFVCTQFKCQTVLFDRTLSGATIPGQSGPGSNGTEVVLYLPQSSSITGVLPSDCLMSYPGHSFGWGLLPLCRDAVCTFYSPTSPANWAAQFWIPLLQQKIPQEDREAQWPKCEYNENSERKKKLMKMVINKRMKTQ